MVTLTLAGRAAESRANATTTALASDGPMPATLAGAAASDPAPRWLPLADTEALVDFALQQARPA